MLKTLLIIVVSFFGYLIIHAEARFENTVGINMIPRGEDKSLNTKLIWEINETEDFYGFAYVSQIEVHNGKLYILESEEWISVFTTSGEYIDQFGTKGSGPGEIQLIKDFDIYGDHIFSLDKSKCVVCKYDLNFKLIWEKKLPAEYIDTLSPEEIEVNRNGIMISGFNINQSLDSIPVMFLLNEKMEIIRKEFIYTPPKKLDFWGLTLNTANRFTADDSGVYFGMGIGKDFLYKYDIKKEKFDYCIEKISPKSGKYEIMKKSKGSIELMCYFNALDINCSENYLITGENAGAFTKEQDKIKVPKDYKNNASLYRKDGTYLGSYFDDSLEYDYSSFTVAVEEDNEYLYLYVFSHISGTLKKIEVNE